MFPTKAKFPTSGKADRGDVLRAAKLFRYDKQGTC